MKKIIVMVGIFATAFVQQTFAQDTSTPKPSELLTSYYNIKDALISGNANSAAINAEQFVKTINGISPEIIPGSSKEPLLKDAGKISATKDLKKQRDYFSSFSANMYALAKTVKLNTDPVYYQYCPMKKATWLSSNMVIKNPYFGSAMPSCGKTTETIQ
ncbi:MAG: DUF3347 domain-containing protein [Bacteroidota bacterium]|nr:DUF3347 domain-containing protein [Bacteroidota bacterium]